MLFRIFTGSTDRGSIELPAAPRKGDSLLTKDPDGAMAWTVGETVWVEGADPILWVTASEDPRAEFVAAAANLPEKGGLKPFDDLARIDDVNDLDLGSVVG